MLDTAAACGIRLRAGVSPEALYRPASHFQPARTSASLEKGGYEALFIAMGGDPYHLPDAVPPDPASLDVWHFDFEFIEGHGAYKTVVERLCRMTGGALSFDEVRDYVDVDEETAWVELTKAGRSERIDLHVNNDWADPRIFSEMQQRLEATGSARRFAMRGLGQDCLIVCQTPDDLKALNRATGLRFRDMKDGL